MLIIFEINNNKKYQNKVKLKNILVYHKIINKDHKIITIIIICWILILIINLINKIIVMMITIMMIN